MMTLKKRDHLNTIAYYFLFKTEAVNLKSNKPNRNSIGFYFENYVIINRLTRTTIVCVSIFIKRAIYTIINRFF